MQNKKEKLGVLIVNLGSPENTRYISIVKFLNQMLSDRKLTGNSGILWYFKKKLICLLAGLNVKKKYEKIWTERGSPLIENTFKQEKILEKFLNKRFENIDIYIQTGMRYAKPSLKQALDFFYKKQLNELIILPLFPQSTSVTSGSIFTEVTSIINTWKSLPRIKFINEFYYNKFYIQALSESLLKIWTEQGLCDKLLISFHGIPKNLISAGDTYLLSCENTARLLAEKLNLQKENYEICFQSQRDKLNWLGPYTEDVLISSANKGIKKLDIISPSFCSDCLETLEEIDIRYKNIFLNKGGERFRYIKALNDSPLFIEALCEIIVNTYS